MMRPLRPGDSDSTSEETCETFSGDEGQTSSSVSGSGDNDGQTSSCSTATSDDDSSADSSSSPGDNNGQTLSSVSSSGDKKGQTTTTASLTCGRALPSGRGRLVWELCCSPSSSVTDCAEALGFQAERLTLETGWDFSKHEDGARAVKQAKSRDVKKVWLSLPCTPWSSIQNLNKRTQEQRWRLRQKKRIGIQMASITLPILLAVVRKGGDFYFEWPSRCHGWNIEVLQKFKTQVSELGRTVWRCRVDGCAYGMRTKKGDRYLLKRWTILTSDELMFKYLCKKCPKQHPHATIQGGETARSAYYPVDMAAVVALVWAAS